MQLLRVKEREMVRIVGGGLPFPAQEKGLISQKDLTPSRKVFFCL
jgi:hypothetical protein